MALISFLSMVTVCPRRKFDRGLAARMQIAAYHEALEAYRKDTGTYPSTQDGLGALRIRPAHEAKWLGPYLPQEIPLDPWGREYVYRVPVADDARPFIVSYGADGAPGGEGGAADIQSEPEAPAAR